MLAPGPRNAITDVPGIRVGNAEDRALLTGATVVLPDRPAVAAVDVRGGGPGTRETDALGPDGTVEAVHAVVLSGGSAYGLEAAGGAMEWLRAEGRGARLGGALVPIVPAAILFDLLTGGPNDWDTPPWRALGREAAAAAAADFALGNAGAGLGASAGRVKGGLGSASVRDGEITLGALAAVNPLGSVVMPGTDCFWTWWLEMAGELGGLGPPRAAPNPEPEIPQLPRLEAGSTTLAVIATDAALDRLAARRLAIMAQDGIARAIRPAHSPLDGDTVFALSTGARALPGEPGALVRLGALAADCLARAIMRGVAEADAVAGLPCWRDLGGNDA